MIRRRIWSIVLKSIENNSRTYHTPSVLRFVNCLWLGKSGGLLRYSLCNVTTVKCILFCLWHSSNKYFNHWLFKETGGMICLSFWSSLRVTRSNDCEESIEWRLNLRETYPCHTDRWYFQDYLRVPIYFLTSRLHFNWTRVRRTGNRNTKRREGFPTLTIRVSYWWLPSPERDKDWPRPLLPRFDLLIPICTVSSGSRVVVSYKRPRLPWPFDSRLHCVKGSLLVRNSLATSWLP